MGTSISIVVTSYNNPARALAVLENLRPAMRVEDEMILLTGCDAQAVVIGRPWIKLVTHPGASIFALRAHIPAICCSDWVIMLEDHALIECRTVEALRDMIRAAPALDMVVFLAKNLTSTGPWDWANFLYTFSGVWAPRDSPPPMTVVTSVIVRRESLGDEILAEGEWELLLIPRIFANGNTAYSNDIYFDHIKHLDAPTAAIIAFHNARAGAALQRKLGIPRHNILYEGWYCFMPRPRILAAELAHRAHEVLPGSFSRIRVMGFFHMIGNVVGYYFGGGRAANRL